MSEFNPFSALTEEAPAVAEDQPEQSSRSKALVAAGALAAVLLGGGAFLLLGGGGGEEELETIVSGASAAGPAAAEVAPAAELKLPASSNLTLGRNPFRALYIQPPPEVPAADPGAPEDLPPGSMPIGDPFTGRGPIGGAPGSDPVPAMPPLAPPGGGTGTGPQQPTAQEHKLVLLRVYGEGADQTATFSIDGKQQAAKVGSTFGPTAEILLLSLQQGPKDEQWTAVLQVGDGDPFDVVTGEPVYVR